MSDDLPQPRTKPDGSPLPEVTCPGCGKLLNAFDTTRNSPKGRPEPGNTVVCFDCCAFCVINDDYTMRLMEAEELAALDPDTRNELFSARAQYTAFHGSKFKVYQFFVGGNYECMTPEGVDAKAAVTGAIQCTQTVGARIGSTCRVIITDIGDNTVWHWEFGKGLVFPKLPHEK